MMLKFFNTILFVCVASGYSCLHSEVSGGATLFSSLKGNLKSAANFSSKALLSDPSASDSISVALFRSAVLTQTSKIGISGEDLQNLGVFIPVAKFFWDFPKLFLRDQKKWGYNNREIFVKREEWGDDGRLQSTVTLGADMFFEGAGDINSPIGYEMKGGKYFYSPSEAMLKIKKEDDNKVVVKSLFGGSFRNTILKLSGKLGSLLNVTDTKGSIGSVAKFFDRISALKPQDVFIIKAFQLFTTAAQNSKEGVSYPRLAHIPLEFWILLKRLMITPDYERTMLNHGDDRPQNAYGWESDKIVFFDDPWDAFRASLYNITGAFADDATSIIQIAVSQSEWDEYQRLSDSTKKDDMLDDLVADVWKTKGYLKRSNVILNNFIPQANFVSFTSKQQEVFVNTLLHHVSQRNSSLLLSSRLFQQMKAAAHTEASKSDISKAAQIATLSGLKNNIDLSLIAKIFNSRAPVLKKIIEEAITKISTSSTNEYLTRVVDYLQLQIQQIEEEKNYYIGQIEKMTSLQERVYSGDSSAEGELDAALKSLDVTISGYENESMPVFKPNAENDKMVSLREFFKIKTVDLKKIFAQPFKGDGGYYYNPITMDSDDCKKQLAAIIFRAVSDLAKAGELLKKDKTIFKMYDTKGKLVQVSGANKYVETIKIKEDLKASILKRKEEARQNALKVGVWIDDQSLAADEALINKAVLALDREWIWFCMQYPFERVKKELTTEELLAKVSQSSGPKSVVARMDTLMDKYSSSIKSEDELKKEDFINALKNNKLYGKDAVVAVCKFVATAYLESIQNILSYANLTKIKTNELEKSNELLVEAKKVLVKAKESQKEKIAIEEEEAKRAAAKKNLAGAESADQNSVDKAVTAQPVQTEEERRAEFLGELKTRDIAKEALPSVEKQEAVIKKLEDEISILTKQLSNVAYYKSWVTQTLNAIRLLPSSLVGLQELVTESKGSVIAIVTEMVKRAKQNEVELQLAKQLAADIYDTKNNASLMATLIDTSSKPGKVITASSGSDKQMLALDSEVIKEVSKSIFLDKIVESLEGVKQASNDKELVIISRLPDGFLSSQEDIKSALSTVVKSSSSTQGSQTEAVNGTSVAGIPAQFGVYDPEYPKIVLRFLAEELCDLTLRSPFFENYGQAIADTIITTIFGYNISTLLSVMREKQLAILQDEINELATYVVEESDATIPQQVVSLMQSSNFPSEIFAMEADLTGITDEKIKSLSAVEVATAVAIDNSAAEALDQQSEVSIDVEKQGKVSENDSPDEEDSDTDESLLLAGDDAVVEGVEDDESADVQSEEVGLVSSDNNAEPEEVPSPSVSVSVSPATRAPVEEESTEEFSQDVQNTVAENLTRRTES